MLSTAAPVTGLGIDAAARGIAWRALGRGAFFVGAAKVMGGAAVIGINIWVARHLVPSSYGVFAFAAGLVLLVDGVLGSALDAAVLRYARATGTDQPSSIECAAIVFKSAGAIAAVAAVWAAARPLSAWLLHDRTDGTVLLVATVAGAGVLLLRSVQVRLQIEGRFAGYACIELLHSTIRASAVVAVLAIGVRSAAPLIAGYAAAPLVIVAAVAVLRMRPLVTATWRDVAAWRAVWRFAGIASGTCGVGALVARLDLLVLAAAGTPAQLGLFGVASTIALVPMLFGAYLSPALTPHIVPYARDGRLPLFFVRAQAALTAGAVIVLVAGVALLPGAVGTLLPASYAPAVPVVQVLLVSGVAGLITFPLTLHFLLFFSPRFYVAMDLASLPLIVPAYAWAAGTHGALGVAAVTAAATVTKSAIAQLRALHIVRRLTPESVNAATEVVGAAAA